MILMCTQRKNAANPVFSTTPLHAFFFSLLFTSRASTGTTLLMESMEAGTRPVKSTGKQLISMFYGHLHPCKSFEITYFKFIVFEIVNLAFGHMLVCLYLL